MDGESLTVNMPVPTGAAAGRQTPARWPAASVTVAGSAPRSSTLAAALEIELVIAGRPVRVGDVEPQRRDGRRAPGSAGTPAVTTTGSRTITSGLGMADPFRRPGDGHDADRAVELRNVEVDGRFALRIDPHRPGEEGDELLAPAGCPAASSRPRRRPTGARPMAPERAVDQLAIEVADLQAEPALAEIPGHPGPAADSG